MPNTSILSLDVIENDIAVLTINDPQKGANVLSQSVLDDFKRHLADLDGRQDLAGLVIRSTKPGNFIAGADIREFLLNIDAPKEKLIAMSRQGQQLFGRLAKCSYVTVAAIAGTCVGGGSEMALWCDRRIFATDKKTGYAFPEVKLGIIPGWGGTARTPRIVGLSNAVELATGGETIDAAAAYAMGLADDVVDGLRNAECGMRSSRVETQHTGTKQSSQESEIGRASCRERG